MKLKSAATTSTQPPDDDLDGRYGKIGISAVAAALAYQSAAKNTAYAPVTPRDDERWQDMAAA